jgi:hypothetical protein
MHSIVPPDSGGMERVVVSARARGVASETTFCCSVLLNKRGTSL